MMRFSIDEDVSDALANALRDHGHDAVDTRSSGNKGQSDPRQLKFAAQHGRILSTANRRDFSMLHEAWQTWFFTPEGGKSRHHSGILIIPKGSHMSVAEMTEIIHEFA